MDWKDYFKLTVLRETSKGSHPYFLSELRVPLDFSFDELAMEKFAHLDLTDRERKLFSLPVRKLLLRHHYFKTAEFDRIVENFAERLMHEKEKELVFSTSGGGIYLFMGILKNSPEILTGKKVICFTSELPLDVMRIDREFKTDVHFILRPHARSFFKDFPTLWQRSNLIDLFEVSEA